MLRIDTDVLSVKIRQIRTTNPKILRFLEEIFGQDYLRIPRPDPRRSAQSAFIPEAELPG